MAQNYSRARVRLVPKKKDYLEGPRSRTSELMFAFDVFREFIKGFRALHFIGPCITIFGSARFGEKHPYYLQAYELSKKLSALGFTIMTGGGPGIMEAANRGAFENVGSSVGCNIILPVEQAPNPYMHKWVTMKYFFVRKTLLIKYSYSFIAMPGGVGTMDELFETLTLIQTKTIHDFPVVLIGKEYYKDIDELLRKMVEAKTISPEDLKLVLITDDIDEAVSHIRYYVDTNYTFNTITPKRWLFEGIFRPRQRKKQTA